MQNRTVPYLRGKAVFVAVLVEGPSRRRDFSSNNNLCVKNGDNGKGYNRKAQLLEYSRHLRASAQSSESAAASQPKTIQPQNSLLPKTIQRQNSLQPKMVQRQNSQIVAVKSKPKYARVPTCLGNWKLVIPKFLQSFTMPDQNKKSKIKKKKSMASTTTKMKAMVKSTFRVERRNIGLFSKLFGKLRKRH